MAGTSSRSLSAPSPPMPGTLVCGSHQVSNSFPRSCHRKSCFGYHFQVMKTALLHEIN